MNYYFFTYNGRQYFFSYDDNDELILLKKDGNEYVKLSDDEKEKIIKYLNRKNGYDYDSEKLSQLISSNDRIKWKDDIYVLLSWLENLIPEECRENLYNNLKTLTTIVNVNSLNTEQGDNSKKQASVGNYNCKNNVLSINKDALVNIWEIAKTTNNPEDFYQKEYLQSLLHELVHMASSKYDPDTGISLSGFDKFPSDKTADMNRGLTEGFTEFISMVGVPGTVEIASGYYIETRLVSQLIQIIGMDVFFKTFFGNKGTIPLQDELNKIINDQDKAKRLFFCIEFNYQVRDANGPQNILDGIQMILLDYLEQKCEQLKIDDEINKIENIFNIYEQILITPDTIRLMQRNVDDYVGLNDNVLRFNDIKKKYSLKQPSIGK